MIPDWLLKTTNKVYQDKPISVDEAYAMLEHIAHANEKPTPNKADLTKLIVSQDLRVRGLLFQAVDLISKEYNLAPLTTKEGRFIKFIQQ